MQGHELVASQEFKNTRAALDLAEKSIIKSYESALSSIKVAKQQLDIAAMTAITKEVDNEVY